MIMGVQVVTTEDLEAFRITLLKEIAGLLESKKSKKWLRTPEVMELLGISEVTLQTLRNNGTIPYRKLGALCYYNIDELDEAINRNLVQPVRRV